MKKWGTLIVMSLSMFIIVIDTTIMNVSISQLVVDLNTTVNGVQAAISIYALVMAAFILIGGKLSDIYGKKRIFLIGVVIYGVGTTIASFSQSLAILIFGWSILEGIGGALMIPNIQTILNDKYEGAALATAFGVVGAVAAVGAAVGPIVGGFFTTYFSWRWAFRVEVLIVIIVLLLSGAIKKDVLPEIRPKFDFLGAILSILGWSAIVLGILLAQTYGFWTAKAPFVLFNIEIAPFGLSITPILVGLGFLIVLLLFRWEGRLEEQDKDGLFRPSVFKTPGLTSGFASRFMHMGIQSGFLYLLPLMLQLSFNFNAIETGIALLPFSLGVLIASLGGARLSSRFYANRLIQIGFIICAVGLGLITASIQPNAGARELVVGGIFGLGAGLIASQIINLIMSSVKPEQAAETAGLNGTFEQLGNAIGVALVGVVMLSTLTASMTDLVNENADFNQEDKNFLVPAVEAGIQLVSNVDVDTYLSELEAGPAKLDAFRVNYDLARKDAFKSGVAVLMYGALLGLVFALWLPKRKLVGDDPAVAEEPDPATAVL